MSFRTNLDNGARRNKEKGEEDVWFLLEHTGKGVQGKWRIQKDLKGGKKERHEGRRAKDVWIEGQVI